MKTIRLKAGKERSLLRRHPWVFDSAIAKGGGDAGETVRVESAQGQFLGWAAFSPNSRIRARVWSFEEGQRIDADFIHQRIAQAGVHIGVQKGGAAVVKAVEPHMGTGALECRARRIDRRHMAGPARQRGDGEATRVAVAVEHLAKLAVARVLEKPLAAVALVQIETGLVAGGHVQRELPAVLADRQLGRAFAAQPAGHLGQTFKLAHGGVRPLVQPRQARDLRQCIERGETFDAIVLDPPKFAPTAAYAERAARAYKDINRLAFRLLAPGGELFTYSCSGGISADLFHKIVASAGTDAGVDGFISERLQGAPDHPMTIAFPEGEYLKGLVVVRR